MKKRIMIVMGTRPEIIKLAPIIMELDGHERFETTSVWTGQHIDLAIPFLNLFGLKPCHSLNLMKENQSLSHITSMAIKELTALFEKRRPDIVMVQGDTSTAFITALCAYYNKIPVAHIEAGLRTGDPYQPFPEEKNRELLSHVATWHFAPTEISKENLLREGISKDSIFVVGNSVVDALNWLLKKFPPPPPPSASVFQNNGKLLAVTVHRRESFGAPLEEICSAVSALANSHDDLKIIIPVHPNPNIRNVVNERLGGKKNISLIEPLDYVEFLHLVSRSSAVLTDSGGVQEEAPSLGVPVLVMRDVTERPEAVTAGASKLVGRKKEGIVNAVEGLLYNPEEYKKMAKVRHPFGIGDTAKKVVKILEKVC